MRLFVCIAFLLAAQVVFFADVSMLVVALALWASSLASRKLYAPGTVRLLPALG